MIKMSVRDHQKYNALREYLQDLIDQHREGAIKEFTVPIEIADMFTISYPTCYHWLNEFWLIGSISLEDLAYFEYHNDLQRRRKMSETNTGKSLSEETRRKMREGALERIRKNHGQINPNYNPRACQIIDLYNKIYGYNLIHAESPATEVYLNDKVRRNNDDGTGECFIEELKFWVDGYDPIRSVVIEYDEHRHYNIDGKLKKRDIDRQKQIEEFLGCTFIRVKQGSREEKDLESILKVA